jgi:hypothetical protein
LSSDLKSAKDSTTVTCIRYTFLERFLEKRRERRIIRDLIKKGSLPPDAVKPNTYSLKYELLNDTHLNIIFDAIWNEQYGRSIDRKLSTPITSEFPIEFMNLLDIEIFDKEKPASSNPTQKQLWKQFAEWSYFLNIKKRFRDHIRCLWSKIQHAYWDIEVQKKPLEEHDIPLAFQRSMNHKLYIARETTDKIVNEINIVGYHHILKQQCFNNVHGETMVDFFNLSDPIVARIANMAVDRYYHHTLNNPSHQSKHFAKEFVEHFCSFTGNNIEPFTTANTVASHSQDHQTCVRNLIQGLQQLSDAVNGYFRDTYPTLYAKMMKLDLGPNVPKSFGVFPSVAINYNVISQFHLDLKDHSNSLCVVCPLGSFEGGQLVFPELKLTIHAKQGQAIAFRSHILVHGNLPIIAGIRHSVVFFVHTTVIKQNRKFSSLFTDGDLDSYTDSGVNIYTGDKDVESVHTPIKTPRKFAKITGLKNSRRSHINMEPVGRGLPAEYKK